MLKTISPILGPDLLHALRAMGHGDDLAIVDANFPAQSLGKRVIRMDGNTATDALDAILGLFPVDDFEPDTAVRMEVVGKPDETTPIMSAFTDIIARHEPGVTLSRLDRFAFYERAKRAYAIVQTGELRLYGCLILRKGVIG